MEKRYRCDFISIYDPVAPLFHSGRGRRTAVRGPVFGFNRW